MHEIVTYIFGALSVGAIITALKTWRDVALLRQDHLPVRELIARLTELEANARYVREAVSDIREHCVNCRRDT